MEKRTQEDLLETIAIRRTAWLNAVEMVVPIVEDHGLVPYESKSVMFFGGSTVTKVDQNIRHIENVADWLLEPIQGE